MDIQVNDITVQRLPGRMLDDGSAGKVRDSGTL